MRQRRKLTDLLQGLGKDERNGFAKFLDSPFFNSNESFALFFRALCKRYAKNFTAEIKDWEALYRKTFPAREFNTHKLDHLHSGLSKLLEKYFIVQEVFPRDEEDRAIFDPGIIYHRYLLVRALGRRNILYSFQKEVKKLTAQLEEAPQTSTAIFLTLYQLYYYLFSHPSIEKFKSEFPVFESLMDALDKFYFLSKLEHAAEAFNRQHFLNNSQYKINLLQEVVSIVENEKSQLSPLFNLYLDIFKLHQKNEPVFYYKLKTYLEKAVKKAHRNGEKETLRELCFHLINYTIRNNLNKDTDYSREQFSIYQMAVDNDLLLLNNRISDISFTNVVFAGAIVGEFDWAQGFVAKYQDCLAEENRYDAVHFSQAHLLFFAKKHKKLEAYISDLPELSLPYEFRIKFLRIRNYFELLLKGEPHKNLNQVCNSYAQYMRRHQQLSKERIKANVNFILLLKRLIKFLEIPKKNPAKLASIKKDIAHKELLVSKTWLLEKIEEIKNIDFDQK